MPYPLPSVSDFKARFDRDFPYSVPAWGATAVLTVVAGVITAAALGPAGGGEGYTSAPTCRVRDLGSPPGTGATITATLAGGAVSAYAVGAGGTGWKNPVLDVTGGAGDETDVSRVRDRDIARAIAEASGNVNQALFCDAESFTAAFLLLAAHCLVANLLVAGEGVRSRFNWLTTSKSAGDLSESFEISEFVRENPFLASLSKTGYGGRYLEIITPLLCGNVMPAFRVTLP